jgi:branched-chain amino acid transport system ATP-binding protein
MAGAATAVGRRDGDGPAAAPMPGAPILAVRDLDAWYGESQVLHGASFDVRAGEVVTLLGRNGVGKSTTLRSIMGIVPRRQGTIEFEGRDISRLLPYRIARLGRAYCPEERGIFASLDVRENLLLPPTVRAGGLSVEEILDLFPNLRERLASPGTKLSGGEQQMLAIGRILRTGARLLLLDEPTEGLAPLVVRHIGRTIAALKARGFTILLVEQNFRFAATVADRHYVMDHGRIVDLIPAAELEASMAKLQQYLGV